MVDADMPECPECTSAEVVVHTHDVAAVGDPTRKYIATYECVECGRQWQPITELRGQTLKAIRRYS
jgi:transposase-like protein